MSGAIAVRGFQLQHDLAGPGAAEPFVAEGGTGDVAAQPFKFLALGNERTHWRTCTGGIVIIGFPFLNPE